VVVDMDVVLDVVIVAVVCLYSAATDVQAHDYDSD
jgi:hypothetical protein